MSRSLFVVVLLLIGLSCFAGVSLRARKVQAVRPMPMPFVSIVANDAETEVKVREFCGGCHVVPRPDLLPRQSWPEEIGKAYRRFRDSERKDLIAPDRGVITDYFSRLATEDLVFPNSTVQTPSPLVFQAMMIERPDYCKTAAVSFLNIAKSRSRDEDAATGLLLCDMSSGWTYRFTWNDGHVSNLPLCKLSNPSHIVECDYDGDGRSDYLVTDLGTFGPSDDMKGSVVLLRSPKEGSPFEVIPVQQGLGRVADAELADLDGDGDDDFVIAEFGFEKAGRLLWLETKEITAGRPQVEMHVIDGRHGAIHSPTADLDGDGDLDLIVLISQEHELILACLNDGHGQFDKRPLFQADSPSFGSSGLELVDLDQDGDLDILFTNGDTMDTMQIKPFHGVNWLENQGHCHFEYHRLTTLPGATRAVSGDFDNDGDVDIVAVAFYPQELRHQKRPAELQTIIWLEQKSPGEFERHLVESSSVGHMAITVGDFDGDKYLDFAVGNFTPSEFTSRSWLTIYRNRLSTAQTDQSTAIGIGN